MENKFSVGIMTNGNVITLEPIPRTMTQSDAVNLALNIIKFVTVENEEQRNLVCDELPGFVLNWS